MLDELLEMYRDGAITGYQVVIDCLQMLDPSHPELVLQRLPDEVLDEMLAYTRRYNPSTMRSMDGVLPAIDQVKAAQNWIEEKSPQLAKRNLAS